MKHLASIFAFAAASLLATAGTQAHAQVKAPPLPAGSEAAQAQGGMSPDELKRQARAHHHKGHVKKDVAKDDSKDKDKDKDNGNGNNKKAGG